MIREATPADLQRLRAIQSAALDEPWDGLLGPAIDGPPIVLVTTPDTPPGIGGPDPPVGYAVAIPDGEVAYLAEFAVAAGHRREGHGSALMRALCDRLAATGHDQVRLTVREDDSRAREFYDEHGFTVQSPLPDHYEDGDGLLLSRELQTSASN